MDVQKKRFSSRLKTALFIRGMTQTDLKEKTKLGKSAISQYVNGLIIPKPDKLNLIADALDINPAWLNGYDVPMDIHTTNVVDKNIYKTYLSGSLLPEDIYDEAHNKLYTQLEETLNKKNMSYKTISSQINNLIQSTESLINYMSDMDILDDFNTKYYCNNFKDFIYECKMLNNNIANDIQNLEWEGENNIKERLTELKKEMSTIEFKKDSLKILKPNINYEYASNDKIEDDYNKAISVYKKAQELQNMESNNFFAFIEGKEIAKQKFEKNIIDILKYNKFEFSNNEKNTIFDLLAKKNDNSFAFIYKIYFAETPNIVDTINKFIDITAKYKNKYNYFVLATNISIDKNIYDETESKCKNIILIDNTNISDISNVLITKAKKAD